MQDGPFLEMGSFQVLDEEGKVIETKGDTVGWPDAQQHRTHFAHFVQAFGGKAFTHGSAYYVDGYAGAALWLPPSVHPMKRY
jgi:hypothetical protein